MTGVDSRYEEVTHRYIKLIRARTGRRGRQSNLGPPRRKLRAHRWSFGFCIGFGVANGTFTSLQSVRKTADATGINEDKSIGKLMSCGNGWTSRWRGTVQGELRRLGRIVLADDPVAADATCARLLGLDPRLIFHIEEAGRFLGNLDQSRITM